MPGLLSELLPHRPRRPGTTTKDAHYELEKRVGPGGLDIAEGRPVLNERFTVAQYLNRWLYEVAKQRTRPMTWRGYEHLVRLHILPTLGRIPLAKLSPQHVHSLIAHKTRESRLAPRTIQYMHSVLRAALNQAVRWRMVHYNAAAMVSAPRGVRIEPKVTMNTYSHVLPALQREAADKMEAVLGS